MITCGRCHEIKPIDDFYIRRAGRNGRQSYCKFCHRELSQRRHAHPRQQRLAAPDGYKECRHCHVVKLIADFSLHPTTRDRRQIYCKPCMREVCLGYYHRRMADERAMA